MNQRDLDYIESRLLAPCVPASDAHQRMRAISVDADIAMLANRLMYAMQEFTNTCRDIRNQLVDLRREV